MASTSTGYPDRMIIHEQPTSSGQVMSVSSGCKVRLNTDAQMQLVGSANINMSTGAYIKDDNVYVASSAMNLPQIRSGLFVLESTKSATYTMQNRPYKGDRREFVAHSTFAHTVRVSTDLAVKIGTTASTFLAFVISPLADQGDLGVGVILRGVSSNRWALINASTAQVAGSTACT